MKMKTFICLFVYFFTFNVNAAFISRDYNEPNDNLLIFDEVSGLEWLSLYETRFLSYDSVIDGTGVGVSGSSGWIDAGFRYATQNEISGLLLNLGADNLQGVRSEENYAALSAYSNFVQPLSYTAGAGYEDKEWWGIYPVLANGSTEIHFAHLTWSERQITSSPELGSTTYGEIILDSSESSYGTRGSFLVRGVSTVPIPSTIFLFMSGMIFLLQIRRKNLD